MRTFQLFGAQTVVSMILHLFVPGLAQHAGCDGMREDLRKKVNGPVNNGASASLHSVSI